MDSSIYSIWLTTCLGHVHRRSKAVMEAFESAEQLFRADEKELRLSGVFTNAEIGRLMNKKKLDVAKRIYERAVEAGDRVIDASSAEYPACFRELSYPPFLIYIRGRLPAHSGICAGVVGTREATMVGRQTAFDLSYNLTKNNVLIISGGAQGIDTQAHKGALQAGGSTICVLGCGTNAFYNMENADLRKEIVRHGAIITEYPPDSMPTDISFPQRNRLIAALSDCCIIVEGGLGSGSLITAAKAAELSRRIFAVPGSLDNPRAMGSNMLLTAGALAVVSHKDVLKWYTGAHRDVKAGYIDCQEIGVIRDTKFRDARMGSVYEPEEKSPVNADDRIPDVVTRPADIKESRPEDPPEAKEKAAEKTKSDLPQNEKTEKISTELLTTDAKSVYDTLSGTSCDADTICRALGAEISTVLSALTELEIFGLIEPVGFGSYRKCGQ